MMKIEDLMAQCGIWHWSMESTSRKGNKVVSGSRESVVGDHLSGYVYITYLDAVFNPMTGEVYEYRIGEDNWDY